MATPSNNGRPTSALQALPRHLPARRAVSSSSGTTSTPPAIAGPSTRARTALHTSDIPGSSSNASTSFRSNGSFSGLAGAAAASPINRSILDLDQRNTSSISLSPRSAPIRRRTRRTAPAHRDSLGGDATATSDLSGLPIQGSSRSLARHSSFSNRNGKRTVSTPLSQTQNHPNAHRVGGGPRGSLITNSSASTSGILGADSILHRSSSPDAEHTNGHELNEDEDEEVYANEGDSDTESQISWTLIDRMRIWRNDALTQHLYPTAIFWGSKVFTKMRDPNDGFWLAQSYFAAGMFSKAERVLTGTWEVREDTEFPKTDKGKGRHVDNDQGMAVDEAEGRLSSSTTERGGGAAAAGHNGQAHAANGEDDINTPTIAQSQISTIQATTNGRIRTIPGTEAVPGEQDSVKPPPRLIRLTDISLACRYLAAQALVRQERWGAAMDLLGEVNPFKALRSQGRKADREAGDGGIKFEASMCHLRGMVQLHLNATDRAKECFLEALSLDVKCYDSFEALVSGSMMDINEEWHFIQGLAFQEHTPEDAEFIRMMYTVRLKKSAHREEMERCSQTLMKEYGLADDPDVLFGLADELYEAMRYTDCYALTSKILKMHDSHTTTLPLHLACMSHLPHLRSKLFLLAHELVDRDPDSVISWYAVGLWYFSTEKWEESRRYFGKGLLLDNRFGPAWIAFAHSFALEGEHDQAITAYSTAQRHFQGTHLPVMFIGMQYLLLANVRAADEYLDAAYSMCQTDPLLLNERGVAAYYNEKYQDAINLFSLALQYAESVQASPSSWAATHLNIGQAYRKLDRQQDAINSFKRCIELEPHNHEAHAALGNSYLYAGREEEAILALHKALALRPGEPIANALLRIALQTSLDMQEIRNAQSDTMRFPLLSSVVAEEIDRQVLEDEHAQYGRRMRNSASEPLDGGDMRGNASSVAATSSPYTTRSKGKGTKGKGKRGRKSNILTSEPDMPVERPASASRTDEPLAEEEAVAMRRRHSYAVMQEDNEQEENENEDSTEDMVEASINSDPER